MISIRKHGAVLIGGGGGHGPNQILIASCSTGEGGVVRTALKAALQVPPTTFPAPYYHHRSPMLPL